MFYVVWSVSPRHLACSDSFEGFAILKEVVGFDLEEGGIDYWYGEGGAYYSSNKVLANASAFKSVSIVLANFLNGTVDPYKRGLLFPVRSRLGNSNEVLHVWRIFF